jgi:hypothetical protein
MAIPQHGFIINYNLVWEVATLSWVVMTQPGGGSGGAVTIADGADAAEGFTTDAAVVSDANGTVSSKLRGLVKIFADVWDSVNHRLKVDGSGVTQPVSGTVTTTPPADATTNVTKLAGTATSVNSGLKDAGTLRVVLATDQPALTNKLLVTPDSVALPANQSVNAAQLAGTATSVNSGTKDAGTLRVVLATDQPALTNKLLVTPDSVALPANQSVNVAQFGGTGVVTGVGSTAAGVPRVTVSNDDVLTGPTALNANAVTVQTLMTGMVGAAGVIQAGTLTGTVSFEQSYDGGTTWSLAIVQNGTNTQVASIALTNPNAETLFHFLVGSSPSHVRVRVSAFTSGTANCYIRASRIASVFTVGALPVSQIGQVPSLFGSTMCGTNGATTTAVTVKPASTASAFTDTGHVVDVRPGGVFPASAVAADGLTNPTITQIGAADLLFNGTTWDRSHNNYRTTTGDTGAKTATFNGATQTNYDSTGAIITCRLGTVSGTTPTMTLKIQWSPDAGTTWLGMSNDTATSTVTTTSQIAMITCLPQANAANVYASAAAVAAQLNIVAYLPRTWRIVYTITGTTPSFTITAVDVAYVRQT